ncbi:MAG: Na(+)/H(+) antiporter nhaA [Moraxellaceae bacterium]|jgi:NhaA family Na+:H+ antiporter|nr:Na(+)/H(+) antiporter nhaA [Moraxellaceae bacterium]
MPAPRYPLEPLFGRVLSPLERFLQRATAGGIILVATTFLTLALSTWMGSEALHHFWEQKLSIAMGSSFALSMSLHHWVNDGLMTLFFLIVGLELKREILVGELASLRDAALPVVAAVGGMVVPAAFYAAFNGGTPTASGWGIPMATDIAFAIGILVMLGSRVPRNLIIFLMALAIADDLGAVLVIALFYTHDLNQTALMAAAGLLALLVLINRGGVRRPLPYALLGLLLWYAVLASGVHATVAGILLAMAIPSLSRHSPQAFDSRIEELHGAFRNEPYPDSGYAPLSNHRMADIAAAMEHSAEAVQSPLLRIEHNLHPWVTFLVIPIFALANAGIDLGTVHLADLTQPVTLGVVFGLVLGKFLGISLFSWAAIKAGLARLPAGVSWGQLTGAAWLGGIGFTMSLFISQLAFNDPQFAEQAKLGILVASALAAAIGLGWLLVATRKPAPVAAR